MEQKGGDWQEEAAGKILTALLLVGAVYFFFRVVMRGIFALMMGGNSENGIYVLFYGGAIALLVIFLMGLGAGGLLWRRSRSKEAPAERSSMLGRGITIGLAVVALAALFIVTSFLKGFF